MMDLNSACLVCTTDIDYTTNVNDSLSGMMLLKSLPWIYFQQWLYQHSIHQLLNPAAQSNYQHHHMG